MGITGRLSENPATAFAEGTITERTVFVGGGEDVPASNPTLICTENESQSKLEQ